MKNLYNGFGGGFCYFSGVVDELVIDGKGKVVSEKRSLINRKNVLDEKIMGKVMCPNCKSIDVEEFINSRTGMLVCNSCSVTFDEGGEY